MFWRRTNPTTCDSHLVGGRSLFWQWPGSADTSAWQPVTSCSQIALTICVIDPLSESSYRMSRRTLTACFTTPVDIQVKCHTSGQRLVKPELTIMLHFAVAPLAVELIAASVSFSQGY